MQGGGWTHQVTQRELPPSKDLAGVNMRLTAGSFRELHWHTADEWAIMLTGKRPHQRDAARWQDVYRRRGRGRSLVFSGRIPAFYSGAGRATDASSCWSSTKVASPKTTPSCFRSFSRHTSPEMLQKNTGWTRETFESSCLQPNFTSLKRRCRVRWKMTSGSSARTLKLRIQYTFKTANMTPNSKTAGGEARIIDSTNFPISANIAAALVTIKPGGLREMHWHPNVSEWQYWVKGKGRMTVVTTGAKARTMDFNANDVGFVPTMAGHCIENTGTEDLVLLEMFKTSRYQDVSLNQWIARMPDKMAQAHLNLATATIRKAPQSRIPVLPS